MATEFADCIAQALPDVYWLEAQDRQGKSWKAVKIAELPPAKHVNGQGFVAAQIVPGGRPEIVLSTGKGIFYIEIPADPAAGNWPVTLAAPEASEQGLAVGDIDGDGLHRYRRAARRPRGTEARCVVEESGPPLGFLEANRGRPDGELLGRPRGRGGCQRRRPRRYPGDGGILADPRARGPVVLL